MIPDPTTPQSTAEHRVALFSMLEVARVNNDRTAELQALLDLARLGVEVRYRDGGDGHSPPNRGSGWLVSPSSRFDRETRDRVAHIDRPWSAEDRAAAHRDIVSWIDLFAQADPCPTCQWPWPTSFHYCPETAS